LRDRVSDDIFNKHLDVTLKRKGNRQPSRRSRSGRNVYNDDYMDDLDDYDDMMMDDY
jgi:hypothetical protein